MQAVAARAVQTATRDGRRSKGWCIRARYRNRAEIWSLVITKVWVEVKALVWLPDRATMSAVSNAVICAVVSDAISAGRRA